MSNIAEIKERVLNDPEYSTEVDPQNKLGFTGQQRNFITMYIQYNDVGMMLASGFTMDDITTLRSTPKIWNECQRIEKAIVAHRLVGKVLSLDELAAFLSSMVMGIGLPAHERLTPNAKLQAIRLLFEYVALSSKPDALFNAIEVESQEIDKKVANMTTEEIRLFLLNKDSFKNLVNKAPEVTQSNAEGHEGNDGKGGIYIPNNLPTVTQQTSSDYSGPVPDKYVRKLSKQEAASRRKGFLIDYLGYRIIDVQRKDLSLLSKSELLELLDNV